MPDRSCPICAGPTDATTVPVSVRRQGRVLFHLAVPAWRCSDCGYVNIDETVQENVIATLEENTEPGDDIVFPTEA